jgi:ATP-binding cassette subfamily B protein
MRLSKQTHSIRQQTTKMFWQFSKPYIKQNVALLLLRPMFLFSAYIGNIYLASIALDKLSRGVDNLQLWRDFGGIILAVIALEIVRLITEQLSMYVLWSTQTKATNDIAAYVYNDIVNRDATFHADHFTGSLVSQTNKFVGAYEQLHDILFWNLYSLIINMTATFVILFWRLPSFAWILLALVFGYTWYSYRANKKSNELNVLLSAAETANTGQLADSVTNILTVKSYAHEEHEIKRYGNGLTQIAEANNTLMHYVLFKDLKLSTIVSLSSVLALVMSVVAATHSLTTIGTIALATALTRDTLMRLREFNSSTLRNLARYFGNTNDMTKILLEPTIIKDPAHPLDLVISQGKIQFKNITFWYPEKTATQSLFDNLNLLIESGQKVGLVGPSGGGKTTITRLLQRFLDIQDGTICIDGQDISKIRQADLRRAISYVPQEPLLFHRSIAENIRYGMPGASMGQVIEAAKQANAHEFVTKLPNGYDTLVGERGVKLSGGQRQRVAIARAMLKNAPILVLDEATSALDSEAEVLIQDALWKLMQGKTTLVIAHRLSTIQKMDRIVVLQNGKIEEDGTHAQLLKNKKGLYAKLWTHQSGGFLND